jgi:hypothetical protein
VKKSKFSEEKIISVLREWDGGMPVRSRSMRNHFTIPCFLDVAID